MKRISIYVMTILAIGLIIFTSQDTPLHATLGPSCYCADFQDVDDWCFGFCSWGDRGGCAEYRCPINEWEQGGECYAGLCAWECIAICQKPGVSRIRTWYWACPDCPK